MIIKNKTPIEEIYDGELIESIKIINTFVNDLAELMYNRIPYEKWENQYQLSDEIKLFAEMIQETQENV